jgi:D-lactate dehydrogenase (cytochrome)
VNSHTPDATLPGDLAALLASGHVETSAEALAPLLADERALYQGRAACAVFPASTAEVAAVLHYCHSHGIGVVPQGGNTGYCGGATPMGDTQVLLNLSKLNRVRSIDPIGMTATVEAGVVLADLHAAVAREDLYFPLSMGSEGSCQLGGNLSTNAGGLAVLKYGMAGELCLGLEVVLADGQVLDLLKPLRKDNSGYHLKELFLGSEGTLGIITCAVVKLFPRPTEFQTAWLGVDSVAAACALLPEARRQSGDAVTSFEYISGDSLALLCAHTDLEPPLPVAEHQVLLELSGALPPGSLRGSLEGLLEAGLENAWINDAVLAENLRQRQALWAIRERIPEAEKHAGRSIKHDVSVPIADIPDYCERASDVLQAFQPLRVSVYGHLGDGNLHYNVLAPMGADPAQFKAEHEQAISAALHQLAVSMGGSFSAEHGIGMLKRDELKHFSGDAAYSLMQRLKALLDPRATLNPGKLVDPEN